MAVIILATGAAGERYLSNLLPDRIWRKVILMWGAMHELRLMHIFHKKKILDPVNIPRIGHLRRQLINSALQSKYDGALWPGKCDETLNINHLGRALKDSILRSSESGNGSPQGYAAESGACWFLRLISPPNLKDSHNTIFQFLPVLGEKQISLIYFCIMEHSDHKNQ